MTTASPEPNVGGIVLCGGRSTRMGRPKLSLPFGPETMLQRVLRILSEVVAPIVVVAARDQEVPALPADVEIVRDDAPDLGPLGGIGAGLKALEGRAVAAYASSCDVPLLAPAFVRRMARALESRDLAIPQEESYFHPLAAVYRVALVGTIERLIAAERMRPVFLLEACEHRVVPVEDLRAVDPELLSLRNVNHPEDYAAALAIAGFGGE
jgi:molybdopterin-guanine dinucleotide biosynthesis protein A